MPDEDEEVSDPEGDTEGDEGGAEVEEEEVDDAEDADGESAADGSTSDGDTAGGSGAEGEKPPAVTAPTGKQLLDLLAGDADAQQLMASTLQQMMEDNARSATAQAEATEFKELVEKGDYSEVGRRVVERTQSQQVRERIADEVLKEVFSPVYADLYAQPELQSLTAEEKDALNPAKYDTDAHYVRALTATVERKRFEKTVEAEVAKRVKAHIDAAGNRETAGKAGKASVGASPAAVGASGTKSSSEMISRGLRRAVMGEDADDDD